MDEKSLSHTKWKRQYHVVIVPKFRRKVIYGELEDAAGMKPFFIPHAFRGVVITIQDGFLHFVQTLWKITQEFSIIVKTYRCNT